MLQPCLLSLALAATTLQANELQRPSPDEATHAILQMMQMPELEGAQVKLGTCMEAIEAQHEGQIACTLAIKTGAGSSESQADFYREAGQWVAQPSQSQDKLPFPDPAL